MSRRRQHKKQGVSIFNVITAMTILITTLVIIGFIAVVFVSDISLDTFLSGVTPTPTPFLPTSQPVAEIPSPTITRTPTRFLFPTWTPPPPSNTPNLGPTNTRRHTLTPSVTPTLPPATATLLPTATPTITPTTTPLGPPPTPTNTRSPFPFTKTADSPIYLRNFANSAGCNWMGVAGEVLDLNGNPVPSDIYRVHVWESGIDTRVNVGSAPAYGLSGWEQFLFDSPVVRTYNVQLETISGTPISQVHQIQTKANCNQNLVYMLFTQNH